MPKTVSIMKEKWKILIVLDACRYDFFSKIYNAFFEGKLECVESLGSTTVEWAIKNFHDYYKDVIYISANPFINSIKPIKFLFLKWYARNHFYKVIDVWRFGWNDTIGTVPPWEVNKIALKIYKRYPDKRLIIHYLQPHEPYLYLSLKAPGYSNPSKAKNVAHLGLSNMKYNTLLNKIFKYLLTYPLPRIYHDIGIGNLVILKLREILNLPPLSPMDYVRRTFGVEMLRLAYLLNLKLVLNYVAILIKKFSEKIEKIVITSDHGEFLGEGSNFGHDWGIRDPILINVPWFIVTNVRKREIDPLARRIQHLLSI